MNNKQTKNEINWDEMDKAFEDFWSDIEENHPESLDPKHDEEIMQAAYHKHYANNEK